MHKTKESSARKWAQSTGRDRHKVWKTIRKTLRRGTALAALALTLFGAGAFCNGVFSNTAFAQAPNPTWPLPGYPNTDGGYQYPLWNGSDYMDSAESTGAARLHAIGIRGQGVSAAVIDTTYDANNSYIKNNVITEASAGASYVGTVLGGIPTYQYTNDMEKVGTGSFLGGTGDIYLGTGLDAVQAVPTLTETMHGTHVSGTIVGMAPDAGLVLLNPASWMDPTSRTDADLLNLKGSIDDPQIAALMYYAARISKDYNIVSLNGSFGDGVFAADESGIAESMYPQLAAGVKALADAGVLGIYASGNEGLNNYIGAPAAMEDAIAIGAMHSWGVVTSFSNQNEKVVLLAPGQNILSSVPGWMNGGNELSAMNGTSMASPHVTGAITLISSGARMASNTEILESLVDSADSYIYDGSVVLPPAFESWSSDPVYVAFCAMLGVDITQPQTLDVWRALQMAANTGFIEPLDHIDYRFLRVDKAYMDLTEKRTHKMADGVGLIDPGLSGIFHAYAGELGADINQDTADIFQRLDAQDNLTKTVVARKMSPRFTNQVAESAHFGTVGIHRSLSRRAELNRLGQGSNGSACNPCNPCDPAPCDPCDPCDAVCSTGGKVETTGWIEGFGSAIDNTGTLTEGSYDGDFAGTSFGIERKRDNKTFGIFGSWGNHRITGDGHADGDWGNVGLYGRIDRKRDYLEGSIAYGYGDYDMSRDVFIPGAVFTDNTPGKFIVLDPMFKRANSSTDAQGFSARIGAGRDLWKINGWKIGPRGEMSLSYLSFDGYGESGADSLNLAVDRYDTTYLEGGIGFFAGKQFRMGNQSFVATGKFMGMYGGVMGDDLTGRFSQYGSSFTVDANHTHTAWAAPEATLAWNVRDGVVISASYTGRFGEKYSENAGVVGLNLYW